MYERITPIYDDFSPPRKRLEKKCSVWTGENYDSFFFTSEHDLKTPELFTDAYNYMRQHFGRTYRIVCIY